MHKHPTKIAPTWADTYRAAAMRLLDMKDALVSTCAADDLVRSALGDAAAKYVLAAREHEEAVVKHIAFAQI